VGDNGAMIDETDPVVRAIQAPFEANMGDFYRRVNDANVAYNEEIDKLEKEKAELEEELRKQREGVEEPEPAKQPQPSQEWDYHDPLASAAQTEQRRWPGTPPGQQQQPAAGRHESTSDYDEPPVSERRRYRATWAEPTPEPEPEPESAPWAPPPAAPAPPRRSRAVSRDDEDFSNESWLQ
jgi:hypothetical protein